MHNAYSTDKAKHPSSTTSTTNPSLSNDPTQPSATLTPLTDAQAQALENDIEQGKLDDRVETQQVRTDAVLRVHGVYMKERREFEVRIGEEGKLELWNKITGKLWR